jgi:hypothetical protein
MSASFPPQFDPLHPQHQTVHEWRHHGPTTAWYINAAVAALIHGDARALLQSGHIVRFWCDPQTHVLDVEVLP